MAHYIAFMGTSEMFGGVHFAHRDFRNGDVRDCRINDQRVGPTAYRLFKQRHARRLRIKKMTPEKLRWNLTRYIRPLA